MNDRRQLNNVHVIKHQRHSNIQNVNLYQHRVASQRKGQIVISRYGCEMKPLSSSAWASGTAVLTAAWPTGSGWSWDTARSPTAGSAALSVGDLSVHVPTDRGLSTARHARSRLLLVSRLPSDWLVHTTSDPNSIAYKQHGLINALPTLHYYAIS